MVESNNILKTQHYKIQNEIQNLSEFRNHANKLRKYINDIEKVFPIIEDVFGQEWEDNYIHIILNDSKSGAGYDRPNGIHTAYFGIWNKAIQTKNYPENLWGCLLHETLHAFMNPIIHGKIGGPNFLDGDCDNEPFVRSFQALVYLKLKKKGEISDILCKKSLVHLKKEIREDKARKLYDRYINMFLKNSLNFSKFIKRLESSNISLFRKDSFWQDLDKAEEALES